MATDNNGVRRLRKIRRLGGGVFETGPHTEGDLRELRFEQTYHRTFKIDNRRYKNAEISPPGSRIVTCISITFEVIVNRMGEFRKNNGTTAISNYLL